MKLNMSWLKYLFWTIVGLLFTSSLISYQGEWYQYVFFSLTLNVLLLNGLNENKTFFDTFIGVFFWLGYWLKMSYKTTFANGFFSEPVGNFNYSPAEFDQTLLAVSVGTSGLLIASLLRRKFLFKKLAEEESTGNRFYDYVYIHRNVLMGIFLLGIILVGVLNLHLGIYQRGVVSRTVLPFGLNGIFKWLLLFGLTGFTSIFLHAESKKTGELSYRSIFLGLFESFFSSVSMLSRGMILNTSGIGVGVLDSLLKKTLKLGWKKIVSTVILFGVLFVMAISVVHFLRGFYFLDKSTPMVFNWKAYETRSHSSRVLFIDRWVGMEGIAAVSSYNGKGWDLWSRAWQEKYKGSGTSLFDREINKSYYNLNENIDELHFITLPGILAFFYYPGSLVFLFFSMLILGVVGISIEWVAWKASFGNVIFSSLISQVVAYRYAHFGYVPKQSYLLFGSIFLTFLIVYGLGKVIDFFATRETSLQGEMRES